MKSKEQRKFCMKDWREANKDRILAYQREWRAKNKDAVAAYQKEYSAAYRSRSDVQEGSWTRNLKKNYNLTPKEFNDMWADQDGKCSICKVEMAPRGRLKDSATVDHNHDTGKVRGILCRCCNNGIGALKDSPEILSAAIDYLLDNGCYASYIDNQTIGDSK